MLTSLFPNQCILPSSPTDQLGKPTATTARYIIIRQLAITNVVVCWIVVRDTPARPASVVRDVMSETKDVAAPRASSVLQEGTDAYPFGTRLYRILDNGDVACNVLLVFIPATLIDVVDEGGEAVRDGCIPYTVTKVGATAVDAKCSGGWDQGDHSDEKARYGTH
jgi:hypothetical protein